MGTVSGERPYHNSVAHVPSPLLAEDVKRLLWGVGSLYRSLLGPPFSVLSRSQEAGYTPGSDPSNLNHSYLLALNRRPGLFSGTPAPGRKWGAFETTSGSHHGCSLMQGTGEKCLW